MLDFLGTTKRQCSTAPLEWVYTTPKQYPVPPQGDDVDEDDVADLQQKDLRIPGGVRRSSDYYLLITFFFSLFTSPTHSSSGIPS